MIRNRYFTFAVCLLSGSVVSVGRTALGQDWPCYGGPNHNGVISNARVTPDPESLEVLWKVPMLGKGFSGPAVVDGRVFILDRRGTGDSGEDVLRVLDLASGEELWTFSRPAPGDTDEHTTGLPSRCGPVPVPTVTPTHVYFSGVKGMLYCLDRATQKPVWQRDLETTLNWKVHSPSPLLADGLVIVSATFRDGGDLLKAFRAADGRPVWQTACDYREPRGKGAGVGGVHAPPILVTIGGVRQIVATHRRATFGIEPATGKVLWQYEGYQRGTIQAEAAVSEDGYLFLASGHDGGSAMAQVTKTDEGFSVRGIYHDDQPHQARACSEWRPGHWWDGHLYHVSNHFAQHGLLCMDKQGNVLWKTRYPQSRLPRFGQSCLTIVDGIGLAMDRGHLHLVDLNPEKYTPLGSIEVFTADEIDPGPQPEGLNDRKWAGYKQALYGNTWAKHAYANGLFLTRNHQFLACVQVGHRAED